MIRSASSHSRGMASVELLVAVTSIGLLLLMVVILIDRSLALERAHDLLRFNAVQLYAGSLLQYQIDHAGAVPSGIDDDPATWQMIGISGEVCSTYCPNRDVSDVCAFLPELVPKYLDRLPQGPFFTDVGPTGYYINKEANRDVFTVGSCITEHLPSIEQKQ